LSIPTVQKTSEDFLPIILFLIPVKWNIPPSFSGNPDTAAQAQILQYADFP
jgi:hypothetical protein